jgi:hypothetical protein
MGAATLLLVSNSRRYSHCMSAIAVCCMQSCESRAVMAEEQLAHLQVGYLQAGVVVMSVQGALLLLRDGMYRVEWAGSCISLISKRSLSAQWRGLCFMLVST